MKKKLIKIVATAVACLSLGALAFVGCNKKGGEGTGSGSGYTEDNEYTVVWNMKGHGTAPSTTKTTNGKVAQPTSNPVDENDEYDFMGWYADDACTTPFDFTATYTATVNIYAKWEKKTTSGGEATEYNIVWNMKGHGTAPTTAKTVNGKVTQPATNPVDNEYDFIGWYADDACTTPFDFNATYTATVNIYAKWEKKTTSGGETTEYNIVWNMNGHGTAPTTTKTTNGKVTKPTDPTDSTNQYTFMGWYSDSACTTEFDFNATYTATVNIYAKWEPKITEPVEGGVHIITSKGDLEAAYVTYEPVKNAVSYNVYCTKAGGTAQLLDAPLTREYEDYLRTDALGLAAGSYTLKVVPVDYQNNEVASAAAQANMVVEAHTREGYAFENAAAGKSASGAYNDDGTLKANARVIYVTDDNKDTVTLNVKYDKTYQDFVGVQNIIGAYKKKSDDRPLAIRFIGNINDPANMPKGDLYVDGVVNGMTIEGVGNDATCNGFGLVIKSSSYVEVRNLGFMNCNSDEGDSVGLQQDNDHIWVHNCDIFYGHAGSDGDQKKGDGALDTKKSTYITHSFNHFWDSGKCNLQGAKVSDEDTSNYITYHHNWYDHSDSRHPRIRVATVHIYNNYYDGNAKYGIGATSGASVFAESNYFRSTANMKPMLIAMQGTDPLTADNPSKGTFTSEDGGIIKAYGNEFNCTAENRFLAYGATPTLKLHQGLNSTVDFDAYVVTDRNKKVPDTVVTKQGGHTYNNFDTDPDFYSYSPDTAEQAKTKVMKYAGRIDGGDFKYTFDNAKEDGNSDVIDELKTMLTNYKDKIVRVFGIEVTSGGNQGGTTGGETGGESGGESGGNDSGATTGDMTATFTATKNISANDVLLKVTDDGNEIASVTALVSFSMKTSGAGGAEAGSADSAFKITLKEGYTYTITMNLGSSSSARKITINGVEQTTGTSSAFADCVWTITPTGDLTITSAATGGKIRIGSITITAVKN